ncbi:hypothetical protein PFISCL1PPCAC_3885, partial [Pristionchus fissidentatus]
QLLQSNSFNSRGMSEADFVYCFFKYAEMHKWSAGFVKRIHDYSKDEDIGLEFRRFLQRTYVYRRTMYASYMKTEKEKRRKRAEREKEKKDQNGHTPSTSQAPIETPNLVERIERLEEVDEERSEIPAEEGESHQNAQTLDAASVDQSLPLSDTYNQPSSISEATEIDSSMVAPSESSSGDCKKELVEGTVEREEMDERPIDNRQLLQDSQPPSVPLIKRRLARSKSLPLPISRAMINTFPMPIVACKKEIEDKTKRREEEMNEKTVENGESVVDLKRSTPIVDQATPQAGNQSIRVKEESQTPEAPELDPSLSLSTSTVAAEKSDSSDLLPRESTSGECKVEMIDENERREGSDERPVECGYSIVELGSSIPIDQSTTQSGIQSIPVKEESQTSNSPQLDSSLPLSMPTVAAADSSDSSALLPRESFCGECKKEMVEESGRREKRDERPAESGESAETNGSSDLLPRVSTSRECKVEMVEESEIREEVDEESSDDESIIILSSSDPIADQSKFPTGNKSIQVESPVVPRESSNGEIKKELVDGSAKGGELEEISSDDDSIVFVSSSIPLVDRTRTQSIRVKREATTPKAPAAESSLPLSAKSSCTAVKKEETPSRDTPRAKPRRSKSPSSVRASSSKTVQEKFIDEVGSKVRICIEEINIAKRQALAKKHDLGRWKYPLAEFKCNGSIPNLVSEFRRAVQELSGVQSSLRRLVPETNELRVKTTKMRKETDKVFDLLMRHYREDVVRVPKKESDDTKTEENKEETVVSKGESTLDETNSNSSSPRRSTMSSVERKQTPARKSDSARSKRKNNEAELLAKRNAKLVKRRRVLEDSSSS